MTSQDETDLLLSAEALLGAPAKRLDRSGSGANSKVMAIQVGERAFAVKRYPDWRLSGSARCRIEWQALRFLHDAGVAVTPIPVAHDSQKGVLILEWIDGVPIDPVTDGDIDQALDFLATVFRLSERPEAIDFPSASEACLSGADIVRQIDERRIGFVSDRALEELLAGPFAEVYAAATAAAGALPQFSTALATSSRRLIPADFGFHNGLREAGGRIRFFDFDYFGWDDPVKLLADFVLHPASRLSEAQERRVISAITASAAPRDAGFSDRVAGYFPLFALRWSLIVLNVFRRDRQPAIGGVPEKTADEQLLKARRLIDKARRLITTPRIS